MFAALSSLTSLPVLVLLGWGVIAPAGVYVWKSLDALFERRAAVAEARIQEKNVCSQRIREIVVELDNASDKRVADAVEAASALAPTPGTIAELRQLCSADPDCRAR